MGRPREFDIDTVLDAAMETFWRQGYDGTSMRDLIAATGLQKGSLYKAFRDKRDLYLATLDRYTSMVHEGWREVLAGSPSVREAIRRWFQAQATYAGRKKGCFAANTSAELAPHDPEIAKRLRTFTTTLKANFAKAIEQGKDDGSIGAHVDPKAAAELFVLLMFGFRVVGKHTSHSVAVVDLILAAVD